jgi:hypothetical protein
MLVEKNKRIVGSPADALYYSILSSIIERYERLLAGIEFKALELEKESLYRPTRNTLVDMDILSKQGIILRTIVESRAYLRHVSIHLRPQYTMQNIVFSDIAGRGNPDDRIVDE